MVEDIPRPVPAMSEVLVRVAASGVAPWDALIRQGKSKGSAKPPLTLGSDFAGVVANAEYAIASARMIAAKPLRLSSLEAASLRVVAVTAWQMLFEYARPEVGQTVLSLGAAGNVGAFAVQFAANAGFRVVAVVATKDVDYARCLGAAEVIDYRTSSVADVARSIDVVIDTVGGDTRERVVTLLLSSQTLPVTNSRAVASDPPRGVGRQMGVSRYERWS